MAASSLQAPLSLDVMCDEGRPMLRRQGSLTPGSSSPKVDWRATSPRVSGGKAGGGQTLRRAQSVGSALSDFLGSSSSRKSLEENSAMRRSGSRGCLDSLEASSNAKAMLEGIGGDDRWDRLEEDREWNFATLENTLRPGGMLHRDTFPSPQFLSQEPWQSVGNGSVMPGMESFPRPANARTQLKRASSTGQKMNQKKSIVMEQAQESFDSLKDRLESSLRMQPECSYAPPSTTLPPAAANAVVPSLVPLSTFRDVGVLGLAKDVGGLKLSTLPRTLKRRKNKERNVRSSSMSNAFSALVFIIKSMHGHALEMQEDHVMKLMMPMQRDMDLSFAWLFQQVFASTPEYMLSIMVLLAEFTVHSLGEDMALASAIAMKNAKANSPRAACLAKEGVSAGLRKELSRRHKAALGAKNEDVAETSHEYLLDELAKGASPSGREITPEEEKIMHALMVEAMKEMETNSGWVPPPVVDKEVVKKLVAPVQATLSPDKYSCFDRTELEYQHSIGSQPTNVMLLSNYAQFLYVVRHDHNRAEEYFHRAIRADPSDGEVLGRFATFLWLGRGDKETAERAFRAAAALDPTNPYHAGNYSHFLWHSEDSRYPKCTATCIVGSE
ncbi:hypothetical protein KC19_2G190500 [Ceratodon purpureus]|uniref:Uncharacterized protein n=1 Tax=Ceratodon purpureus TaxID=3225 RepID=A0A8T0IYE6_CERPU|nr:hypothetical protein KC19_2G190500 [Ceratodon purpureus]